ncbi:hypothetical protein JTB14_027240 [Gonioctena quinquepunctata]|nr:hypothetical protein JTB14_027240 [Gonioctena quinquepunctata]
MTKFNKTTVKVFQDKLELERPTTPDNSHQPSMSGSSLLKNTGEITDSSLRKVEKETFLSPEEIKPFPKAAARRGNWGRKRGRCIIATNTPEKLLLEGKTRLKESKLSVKKIKQAK